MPVISNEAWCGDNPLLQTDTMGSRFPTSALNDKVFGVVRCAGQVFQLLTYQET